MVVLVVVIVGSAGLLVSSINRSWMQAEHDKKSFEALARAKEALVGYAVAVNLTGACANTASITCRRPGDLPCPDSNNDGTADTPCSGNALGRLPWKTLGLPDLRDGSDERLWYAVSARFKNNPRTICTNSVLTSCLNSDTPGSITIRANDGTIINDGGNGTGVVATLFAPGNVLQRQDGTQQVRSGLGINTASNYLDIATVGGTTEDNANFTDGSSTNGFIQGNLKDSDGNAIVNDRLLAITQDNIMQVTQKRVAAEVRNCLVEYAAMPQNQGLPPNLGYYPWATLRTAGPPVVYNDSDRREFGRIPDLLFEETCDDTGGSNCDATQSGGMSNQWGPTCTLANSNWWVNWKELVFYGFAHGFRPHDLTHNHACSNSACLVVNPPSSAADKSFVIIVAGKQIGTQVRSSNTDKSNFANYLEGQNSDGLTSFEKSPLSATFNDWVVFY